MTLFLITAPSGAGKTTVASHISQNKTWGECISHTTREVRKGEVEGKTYYYLTKEEFDCINDVGNFIETVTYDRNYYGISKNELIRASKANKNVYIIVEYEGYKQIKELYPDAVGIFMHMSKEDCMANMLLRGDSLEKALVRTSSYESEMKNRNEYDYVIKNVRNKMNYALHIITNIIHQNN